MLVDYPDLRASVNDVSAFQEAPAANLPGEPGGAGSHPVVEVRR